MRIKRDRVNKAPSTWSALSGLSSRLGGWGSGRVVQGPAGGQGMETQRQKLRQQLDSEQWCCCAGLCQEGGKYILIIFVRPEQTECLAESRTVTSVFKWRFHLKLYLPRFSRLSEKHLLERKTKWCHRMERLLDLKLKEAD